jgi:probable rRNA maturation factor
MAIEVVVTHEFSRRVPRALLKQVARRTLRAEGVPAGRGLTIVIAGDEDVRRLNRQFLGVNAPTDVLSFSSDDGTGLGDVVISYETASRNASAVRWLPEDELCLLVVHGILHLLGYDDSKPHASDRMWRRQEDILGRIAVNDAPSNKRPVRNRSRPK